MGSPASQPLGDGHDVRLDAVMLAGEEGPGAPHARLHLVQDEQDAVLLAEFLYSL